MNPAVCYKLLNIALVEGGGDKITQRRRRPTATR
jgi:hypothetical protein